MRLSKAARQVGDERLTYLSTQKFLNLEGCAKDVNRGDVPGCFVEAGVALGGSAIVLSKLMGDGRRFHGYDLFGQIPPPGEHDDAHAHERYAEIESGRSAGIGGDDYYGYLDDLYDRVVASFERYGLRVDGERIALHKGLFEDTLTLEEPVALAHIDADWYDSVMLCLERLHPLLSAGGYFVLDDYNDYGGCKRAADEFLARHPELETVAAEPNLVLRRAAA